MVAQSIAVIALGLLAASGVAKVVDPVPTTGAMREASLPASNPISIVLGVTEVVVAAVALAWGGTALIVAAALYVGFALFTFGAVRKRIPIQSCGCFGRDDTPPNAIHVVYNVVSALALVALVAGGLSPVDWAMPVVELVLYLGFAAVGVVLSYLVMTRLPQLLDLARRA